MEFDFSMRNTCLLFVIPPITNFSPQLKDLDNFNWYFVEEIIGLCNWIEGFHFPPKHILPMYWDEVRLLYRPDVKERSLVNTSFLLNFSYKQM